jgi:hypothetical protein
MIKMAFKNSQKVDAHGKGGIQKTGLLVGNHEKPFPELKDTNLQIEITHLVLHTRKGDTRKARCYGISEIKKI